jgi:ankyrin only family protein
VYIRDSRGNTALHLACQTGDLECVKALTEPVTVAETNTANLKYAGFMQQVPQNLEERNYDGKYQNPCCDPNHLDICYENLIHKLL